MNGVYGFFGEYRWLSNFWPATVRMDGVTYPTVENAYQAAKTITPSEREQFVNVTPGRAKQLGKAIWLRKDWDREKEAIMLALLRQKFRHPDLQVKLIMTADAHLEESNDWGDVYWGVCNGKGQNRLGHLLMAVRAEVTASNLLMFFRE
jgi:ribA/ribD-fused uncharacterized protein